MQDLTDRAAALAKRLKAENEGGRSWRTICREDYADAFSHTVLRNLACDGVIPKDRRILIALGLKQPHERTETEKRISALAKETADSVVRHKPTKKEYAAVRKVTG
jgi:hypothetical protein